MTFDEFYQKYEKLFYFIYNKYNYYQKGIPHDDLNSEIFFCFRNIHPKITNPNDPRNSAYVSISIKNHFKQLLKKYYRDKTGNKFHFLELKHFPEFTEHDIFYDRVLNDDIVKNLLEKYHTTTSPGYKCWLKKKLKAKIHELFEEYDI